MGVLTAPKRVALQILCLFTIWGFAVGPCWATGAQSVHALRSAYLYYFSHFIAWPDSTKFEHGAIVLCALCDDPQDRQQLLAIHGKNVGKVQLQVELLDVNKHISLSKCHMLYVVQDYEYWLAQNAELVADDTLLVTEGQLQPKGLVHLFIGQKKLKFAIDQQQLSARGFKASSKLLRLSRTYED